MDRVGARGCRGYQCRSGYTANSPSPLQRARTTFVGRSNELAITALSHRGGGAHEPLRKAAAGLYSRVGRAGVGMPDDRSSSSGEPIRALEYRAVGSAKDGSAPVSPAGA